MDQSKINMFMGIYGSFFKPSDLLLVKSKLEQLSDDDFYLVQSANYQKPDTILLIAIILGWERFWMDDVVLGILKILTCYGCLIWYIVDIFSAKKRAMAYNLSLFNQLTLMVK